jgi:hypothetical protein
MNTNIITNPPANWVERLRRENRVWLVKEQKEAFVDYPYEPAEPGFRIGRIGIRGSGAWFVGLNGEGLNGDPLIQPIEGHLPDNPEPLPEPLIRQMQRSIEHLENRVRNLEYSPFSWEREVPEIVWKSDFHHQHIEDPCSYCNGTGKAIKSL